MNEHDVTITSAHAAGDPPGGHPAGKQPHGDQPHGDPLAGPTPHSSTRVDSSSTHGRFVPGTIIADRYRVVGLLGRGGMGEVYRADDLTLGQTVALKFVSNLDPLRLELFHSEVRLTRQISHPNVCRVYDIGQVDGQHFLSMEYIDGEDLRGLLTRIGRLPKDKGVQIAQQLCAGLAAAHDAGVLHRDLKPANIMLDGRGQVRITDFGLAALNDAEGKSTGGTPAYMAPEQLATGKTTVQSDLYALGLILYEVFTGQRVHKGSTVAELRREHEESMPTRPSSAVDDMDPAVERVILRCLERQDHERPSSARAVAAALPGGDPLAAALAAGETPSPAMVAAAGDTGTLSLAKGIALLATIVLMAISLPFLADQHARMQVSRFGVNRPEVLEADARRWNAALSQSAPDGLAEPDDADSVYGYIKVADPATASSTEPDVRLQFWYRRSPHPLIASNDVFSNAWDWAITAANPPPILPGMVSLRLDPEAESRTGGQLLEYLRIPMQAVTPPPSPPTTFAATTTTNQPSTKPSGIELLAAAGVVDDANAYVLVGQVADLPDVEPPPVYADNAAVWQKTGGDTGDRLLVADRGGQVVYFRRMSEASTLMQRMVATAVEPVRWAGMSIVLTVFAGILSWRNIRTGRADTRGALRCAAYVLLVQLALWPFAFHHVADLHHELKLGVEHIMRSLAYTVRLWLYYVALEPYVRRIWPKMLISWSRVLSGRFADPLVGRDLMVGSLFGVTFGVLTAYSGRRLPTLDANALLGMSSVMTDLLQVHQGQISYGLANAAMLLFFRLILRKGWAACLAMAALTAFNAGWANEAASGFIWFTFVAWGLALAGVYLKFGLLSAIVGQTVLMLVLSIPHTAHFGQWYASASNLSLTIVLLIAGFGFYTSTIAGRLSTAATQRAAIAGG